MSSFTNKHRYSGRNSSTLIGCSQNHTEVQGLAACTGDAECGAVDWDPAANQSCLWRGVTPNVHAVESDCGVSPHPAGCACYEKDPLPTPPTPPPPRPTPPPCTSADGCQLNGVCHTPGSTSGSCECFNGWKGLDCGELDLIPGPRLVIAFC
jgi:hypothetical protein